VICSEYLSATVTPVAVKLALYIVSVAVVVSLLFRQFQAPWVAFREGETAFAHGNLAAATQFYQKAAERLDDPRILEHLAQCLLATGNLKDAQTALARIVEKHPGQLDAIRLLAGADQQAQEPLKAIPLFTRYLALGRKLDSSGELQLADIYRQAKLYDQAAPYFLEAAKDPKEKTAATIELAQMRGEQGDYDEAIALLREVLVANPTNRQARISLARILNWAGDYKGSEDEYRKLLSKQ
jgi:tetratricopeptide (TPR) repeat protein